MPGEKEDARRGSMMNAKRLTLMAFVVSYSAGCLEEKTTPEEVTMINAARLTWMVSVPFCSAGWLEEKRVPEEVVMMDDQRLTRWSTRCPFHRMPEKEEDARSSYDDERCKAHIDGVRVLYSTRCLKKEKTPEEVTMMDAARLTWMAFVLFRSTRCLKKKRMPEEVTTLNDEWLTGSPRCCNARPSSFPAPAPTFPFHLSCDVQILQPTSHYRQHHYPTIIHAAAKAKPCTRTKASRKCIGRKNIARRGAKGGRGGHHQLR